MNRKTFLNLITLVSMLMLSPNAWGFMDFTHMKPYSGPWGSKVRIYGKNFDIKKVKIYFNGKKVKPLKVFKRSIVVVIPEGSKSGWFEVEQDGRRLRSPKRFLIKNKTILEKLVPSSGIVDSWITLKGKFFNKKTKFYIGFIKLQSKFINSHTVKVFIPKNISNNFFSFTSLNKKQKTRLKYKIIAFPQLKSFSPKVSWYGKYLTIRGKNFCENAKVIIGGKKLTLTKKSRGILKGRIPQGIKTSFITVKCYGRTLKSRHPLRIKAPFGYISSVSPSTISPGEWVTLKGFKFTRKDRFWLGSVKIKKIKFISSSLIKVKIPANSHTDIFHHESFGRIRPSGVVLKIDFPPVITSIYPLSGWYGDKISVKGNHFCSNPKIFIDDKVVSSVSFINEHLLSIRVPSLLKGGIVKLKCDHWITKSKKYLKITPPAVKISNLSPKEGPPGTVITIYGVNFPQNMKVLWNNTPVKTKVIDHQMAKVTISGRGKGAFSLFAYGRYWKTNSNFNIAWPKPNPVKFYPKISWHRGVITIAGRKFCANPKVSLVHWKNKRIRRNLKVLSSNANFISVLLPTKAFKGSFMVKCYRFNVGVKGILSLKPPVGNIASIRPLSGPPGTWVILNGAKFRRNLKFYLGTQLLHAKFISSNRVSLKIPKNAKTGRFSVVTGRTRVVTPFKFTIAYPQPVIAGFTPDLGWINNIVSITGRNFCPKARVLFPGGKEGRVVRRLSHTYLKVKIPKGAKSGYLKIKCARRSAVSSGWFTMAPPYARIMKAEPSLACPGDKILIKGINFNKNVKIYLGSRLLFTRFINQYNAVSTIPRGSRSGDLKVESFGKKISTPHSIIIKSRICRKRKKNK